VAAAQEHGYRSTHRVANRYDRTGPEDFYEGGSIIGARLEREGAPYPATVAPLVHGDDVEVFRQRGITGAPVEVRRGRPAV
jgi:hypothetical protein